ncbi:KUP/HAK/KT family potassium transporter [Taibaiella lutea]|uniref:KUP/HAK/KT family potassium transporter n=1 Tax=Taibaiella lutea TaxID=2608001 RepID=A0A5M6CLN3_9BACT|nr:KUP/HAK/KT family potassium transporter [Taibaiella lutea]KAA5536121.1 KUP/HAK/KT family potassium transporter [Taibaiella lutea]
MGAHLKKASLAGIIIALGIVFGDIGTSPLYAMNAIVRDKTISDLLVIGGVSCVIWTLTLQTTIKYVILTLRADNNGEGGIFSLFALVRRHAKWIVFFAMIGGAALLADGLITPPITVTSAIEGLDLQSEKTNMIVVLVIIAGIFFMQQFGTQSIGKLFGPIMVLWFMMMAVTGTMHLGDNPHIFSAFNPYWAIKLLTQYPQGFWLLGSVFLCTTGAEALYSDLGHVGKGNIRASWIFVKICLILNYIGQGSWLLSHHKGGILRNDINIFFALIPEGPWRIAAIVIATLAAIIASQALISGSFTLVNEAIKLNLWPKMKINFPTTEKGQLFIPGINFMLWLGCTAVVIFFQASSAAMEGAYGLSITITMIMTSLLLSFYLFTLRVPRIWIGLYLAVYLSIEVSFLIANLSKFPPPHNGFVTVFIAGGIFSIMFMWYRARKIKNRYVEFVRLEDYVPIIQELSNDRTIPKYATHLVYMTSANFNKEIEHKIIFSILYKKPKRADIYWFVHVDVVDEPYTMEYVVQTVIPNEIIRIEFRLGFRVEHRIQMMFKKVVEEMVANKEVNVTSRYESLSKNNVRGDFRFIVLEKFLSRDNALPIFDKIIMRGYFILKKLSLSEERSFGLDMSDVTTEKFPLIVSKTNDIKLQRVGE